MVSVTSMGAQKGETVEGKGKVSMGDSESIVLVRLPRRHVVRTIG